MYTIGQLAKRYSLSRSTLLYYDRLGVLSPSGRTESNYRLYSDADLEKMERIILYRSAGLSLDSINDLLTNRSAKFSLKLEQRLANINTEIQTLRSQQKVILNILGNDTLQQNTRLMNKETWVSILSATGLDEEGMRQWHIEFEKSSPEAHQDFLESIGIEADEISAIRDWSKSGID